MGLVMSTPRTNQPGAARPRILVFTGEGAGKTSAALGKVLRLVGRGYRVAVVQFLKHDPDTGELSSLAKLGVTIEQCGMGFVPNPESSRYPSHRAAAQAGLERARALCASHDAVVLDEICGAIAKGLIAEAQVLALFAALRPGHVCICTGRNATPDLIAAADTVSTVSCVKHALRAGIAAQDGVER
jgi:cob(I)alamin adenosyltransferase